jgi:tRNA G26 N,N-dimethylase Trm1
LRHRLTLLFPALTAILCEHTQGIRHHFSLAFDDCADRLIRVNTLISHYICEFWRCFIFPDAGPLEGEAMQSRAETVSRKKTCKTTGLPKDKPVCHSTSAGTGIHERKIRSGIEFESRI